MSSPQDMQRAASENLGNTLGGLGQASVAPREPKNVEHATNKVQNTIDTLEEAIVLAGAIIERLEGPRPQKEAEGLCQPDSPGGQLDYLHDRCDTVRRSADRVRNLFSRINDMI